MADATTPTQKPAWLRWLPIAGIAAAAVLGFVFLRDYLTFSALAENREALIAYRDSNYVLTVAIFMAVYVAAVAFSLPGAAILTLAGGFLFGLFPGVIFIVVAATIGATLLFLAAKTGFGDRLAAKMDASEGAVKTLKDGIREDETSYLFVMRLVPAVPFFVANIIPALVGVSLAKYVVTTFLGILPGSAVYTWVGAGLGEVFARGETPDLGIIFEPHILGPIVGLALLAVLPVVVKKLRRA
ncbi:TVP38/TMEM64 family protein [Jannaschia sp. Os4]|uniref:TVP38/TMEM64 family protein n=1 Tax=Jannaschia sp. Os4 TaxID=2807617 RepID=UPI00193A18B7|nr:VTT domain-containing protein [Jannaschia sp. Os4]MBM2577344.1 TVP38/TMEM64 family protein [Jannaschia sp. Os4]